MNIPLTTIAAWWGGVMSSVLFVFEVFRFIRERPTYDVEFNYKYKEEYMMRQRPEALMYTIRNTSERTTTITGVEMTEWIPRPKKRRPLKIRFYVSGIMDETKGENFPQKLEPGDYIVGRIDADTIRQHAPKSCRPIVLGISDTLHKKPRRITLRIPPKFLAPLAPLDQLWNELRISGNKTYYGIFVQVLAKTLDLKTVKSSADPSGILHVNFPRPDQLDPKIVSRIAEEHGLAIKSANFNIRLGGPLV